MAEPIADNGWFQTKLIEFETKLAEFRRVLTAVQQANPSDPELRSEKQDLLGRAEWIETTISKTQSAINWANQQLRQLGDVFNDDAMGLAPLAVVAAVAAIAGAVAYMSSWIGDAYIWAKKVEVAEQMTEAGASGAEIRKAIEGQGGGLAGLGSVALLALVGLGVWLWQSNK